MRRDEHPAKTHGPYDLLGMQSMMNISMPLCLHQRAYLCPSSGACKHLECNNNALIKNARDVFAREIGAYYKKPRELKLYFFS